MRSILLLVVCQFIGCQGCKDTGVNCAQLSPHCSTPEWESMLTRHCPATCGKCRGDSSPCVDRAYNCALLFHRCSDPIYAPIMIPNCAATCGICKSSNIGGEIASARGVCSDIAHNCPLFVDRCEDDVYGAMMRTYCRRTCRLCKGNEILTNEIFSRPEKKEGFLPLTPSPPVDSPNGIAPESGAIKVEDIDQLLDGASDLVRLIIGWRRRLGDESIVI